MKEVSNATMGTLARARRSARYLFRVEQRPQLRKNHNAVLAWRETCSSNELGDQHAGMKTRRGSGRVKHLDIKVLRSHEAVEQ